MGNGEPEESLSRPTSQTWPLGLPAGLSAHSRGCNRERCPLGGGGESVLLEVGPEPWASCLLSRHLRLTTQLPGLSRGSC